MSNPATPNLHEPSAPNSPPAKGEYPEGGRGFLPKLRLAEFKNKPAWQPTLLGKLARRVKNRNTRRAESRVLTNSAEHGVLDQREYFDKDIATNTDNYFVVEKGDYVYNPRKSAAAPVGPISKNKVGTGVMSPLYTVFRFHSEANDFFAHYFKSSHWHGYLRRVSNSGARHDRMAIANYDLMRMPIPIPSPPEQQKIADCLNSLDDLIAAEGRKLEALRRHKQGLMQQLFPRAGETVPRLRFPEFKDSPDWKKGKCLDIADILPGFGFPNRFQGNSHGQYPFYKVSDISQVVEGGNKYIREANNYIETDVLKEIRAKLVPAGTIIFAKIGEAIRSNRRVITTIPAVIDNNTAGVKSKSKSCSDEFLFYLWSKVALSDHAGGVVPAVSKSALENIPLCYPSDLGEQQCIADFLSILDSLIGAQLTKLDALRAQKQGLMQQLFPSLEVQVK